MSLNQRLCWPITIDLSTTAGSVNAAEEVCIGLGVLFDKGDLNERIRFDALEAGIKDLESVSDQKLAEVNLKLEEMVQLIETDSETGYSVSNGVAGAAVIVSILSVAAAIFFWKGRITKEEEPKVSVGDSEII